jgi:uncharacterized lipoprotein YajG
MARKLSIKSQEVIMSKFFFVVLCCVLVGCQGTKNSIETGASTILMSDSPVIEKIDLNIKFKKEW